MKNGIGSVLVELAGGRNYLLPRSMLAEIVPVEPLTPIATQANWILGKLAWRGQEPAVIDPEKFCGVEAEQDAPLVRYAVLYALEHLPGLSYYAVPLASMPHPLRISPDDIMAESVEDPCELEMYQAKVENQTVTLLDFVMLERRLASQLASV